VRIFHAHVAGDPSQITGTCCPADPDAASQDQVDQFVAPVQRYQGVVRTLARDSGRVAHGSLSSDPRSLQRLACEQAG
jgi:hypothetical protein